MVAPLQHADAHVAGITRQHEGKDLPAAGGQQLVPRREAFEQEEQVDWRLFFAGNGSMCLDLEDVVAGQFGGALFFGGEIGKEAEFSNDRVHDALLSRSAPHRQSRVTGGKWETQLAEDALQLTIWRR